MANDLVLVRLDAARIALREAKTIQNMKKMMDIGAALELFAKRQGASELVKADAHAFHIETVRLLGEALTAMPQNNGTRGQLIGPGVIGGTKTVPPIALPTIKDLGVDKKTSTLARKLALLPDSQLAQVVAGTASITQALREVIRMNTPVVEPPAGKYRIFYADPPWSYGNTQPDYHTEQRDHYATMTLDALCALPVKTMAEDNAILFLWATSPILEESFDVIRAWGFKYKTSFVWDKVKHNMGHYNSVRHEFLLICVRGSCQPDVRKLFDSVVTEERTTHSKKPQVFYDIIETLYTHGKRIELFARNKRKGWDTYGSEDGKFSS